MGICMCKQLIEDDIEITEIHKVEIAMRMLRNKIKAKKMPIVWLEGSEGSGKLNHACNITERFGYSHIEIDKMIKEESERGTRRGKYIKNKISTRRKIPDRLVIELIKESMVATPDCNGYLISGFPKNPKQASHFVREIAPVDCILYLEGEALTTGSPVETVNSVGDNKENKPQQGQAPVPRQDEGDAKLGLAKNVISGSRIVAGKYDVILERINANEPPADVFLKIESAILEKTSRMT